MSQQHNEDPPVANPFNPVEKPRPRRPGPRGPVENRARKARRSSDNKIANQLRYLPASVKQRWVKKFGGDAEIAFKSLLTGSHHVCDKCGCSHPNPHAVRLYCELADAVGPANSFILNFTQSFGAKNESDLRRLVESGRRLEGMMADASASSEEYRDAALDLLGRVLREHPEWRALVAARLSSMAEVVQEGDNVEQQSTNGHGLVPSTNGH